jgi:hypothetical protein
MGFYLKDPGASIDYAVDWGAGYLAGETIAESLWSVEPEEAGGLTVTSSVREATRTAAQLTGGIAGHVYRVANRVTLSSGRSDERSLTIRADER